MKQSTINTLACANRLRRFKVDDMPEQHRGGIRHLVRAGCLKRSGDEYVVTNFGEFRLKMSEP